MNITRVWIVERESGDGPEVDVFLNQSLAKRWAETCGGWCHSEPILDEADVMAMTKDLTNQEHTT